jgi:hypothetical protein
MITLDYKLSSPPGDRTDRELVSASESELRYSLFLGDVVFRVGDADFSANWGWVPVLDFALGLEHAARELLQGKEEAEFEFTESDSAIRFQRDDGDVFISASYAPHRTVANLEDLVKAVRAFRKRVVDDLSLIHPQLRMNSTMRNLVEGSL